MRKLIVVAGWVWFVVAIPQVTDTDVEFLIGMGLLVAGPIIGLVWVLYSFDSPSVFRTHSWSWLSVPVAGLAPVLLAETGWGLIARVALSESELRAFAEAVRDGRDEVRYGDAPRRVGLFLVYDTGANNDEGEVVLVTSRGFLNNFGLAYRPHGPRLSPHWRYHHLYGPWEHYQDDF